MLANRVLGRCLLTAVKTCRSVEISILLLRPVILLPLLITSNCTTTTTTSTIMVGGRIRPFPNLDRPSINITTDTRRRREDFRAVNMFSLLLRPHSVWRKTETMPPACIADRQRMQREMSVKSGRTTRSNSIRRRLRRPSAARLVQGPLFSAPFRRLDTSCPRKTSTNGATIITASLLRSTTRSCPRSSCHLRNVPE